jgi:hypothetical protein
MVGQSKCANIQCRKAQQDAKRGMIGTRLIHSFAAVTRGVVDVLNPAWVACLFLISGWAFAMPNPQYALDKRAKAPEALGVEVKAVKRLGNDTAQAKANCAANPRDCMKPSDWPTEPVEVTVVVKTVERSAVGLKVGDELCVAYTTHNLDFKGPMPVGLQYPQAMRMGVAYKLWLISPGGSLVQLAPVASSTEATSATQPPIIRLLMAHRQGDSRAKSKAEASNGPATKCYGLAADWTSIAKE